MRLLLDTHTLLWLVSGDPQLSHTVELVTSDEAFDAYPVRRFW
jgi:PIN domain nuclease of toxin-antitoxin system